MGSISIGAYVPPDVTTGGVLSAVFAISLGQGTETAIALAMPIATLALALGNAINALGPLLLGIADKSAEQGNIGSIYAIHWILGLLGVLKRFGLCFDAFYFGAEAVQGVLDWIPSFVLDGFGVAANILPVMTSYMNVPVLGVSLIAIIIAIEKFGFLGNLKPAPALEGDDDDDF